MLTRRKSWLGLVAIPFLGCVPIPEPPKSKLPARPANGLRANEPLNSPEERKIYEEKVNALIEKGKKEGLKITETAPGEGVAAKGGSKVEVIYTGTLENGTKFDSNTGGTPYPVTLGQGGVIEGWEAGLAGIKKGGKRKLVIPGSMAYPQGRDKIPPGATLVFEVEAVNVTE